MWDRKTHILDQMKRLERREKLITKGCVVFYVLVFCTLAILSIL